MIASATDISANGQISNRDFVDQPVEHTVVNAAALQARLAEIDSLTVFRVFRLLCELSLAEPGRWILKAMNRQAKVPWRYGHR